MRAFESALPYYKKVRQKQNVRFLVYSLAEMSLRLKQHAAALKWLAHEDAGEENTYEALRGRALALEGLGQHRKALAVWQKLARQLQILKKLLRLGKETEEFFKTVFS